MSDSQELAAALMQRGLVPSDALPPAPRQHERPWFVAIVLGGAGWLAGVFALLFVGTLFKPSGPAGFGIAGFVMLAAAFGLYSSDREDEFFGQLALALSIAAQLSLAWAASEFTKSTAGVAALVAAMQCMLVVIMPNRFAKLLAAFFACIAWALTIRLAWWGESSVVHSQRESVVLGPALVGWCVIWIPVMLAVWKLIDAEARWMSNGLHRIARPLLSGLLLSLAAGTLASAPLGIFEFDAPARDRFNWLALWPLLSASAAMFGALCAFRVRNSALIGVCAAAMLAHVIHFYYLLGLTLLLKSCIMFSLGIALLLTASFRRGDAASGGAPL